MILLLLSLITSLEFDAYEHLFTLELDHTSRWEVEYFHGDFNWEVGDQIKIYYQPDIYHHQAENLDKHNQAYLILMFESNSGKLIFKSGEVFMCGLPYSAQINT